MNHKFSKAFDENKEIRIVFRDISRAFDQVWHKCLLFELRMIGISENFIGWFQDYEGKSKIFEPYVIIS